MSHFLDKVGTVGLKAMVGYLHLHYKNYQKLRKTSNANVLQNFAFADHIVSHNVEDKPK